MKYLYLQKTTDYRTYYSIMEQMKMREISFPCDKHMPQKQYGQMGMMKTSPGPQRSYLITTMFIESFHLGLL